jgi:hypothetical protein
VDDRVLHVERVAGDDPRDEVLLAVAVQGEAEAAAVDGAALLDELLQGAVDVLLTGEPADSKPLRRARVACRTATKLTEDSWAMPWTRVK